MKLIASVLLIMLVPGGYYFCDLFAGEDLNHWWYFRQIIYSAEVALAFYILQLNEKNIKWEIIWFLGVSICVQNMADNIGKIYGYNWFDLVVIIITLFLAYKKYGKFISKK